MDNLEKCLQEVEQSLKELEGCPTHEAIGSYAESSQFNAECIDRNLYKILDQQPIVKTLIEIDSRIIQLRKSVAEDKVTIDRLRRDTARICSESVEDKAELLAAQRKEVS